jgi:hypothetical protein
MQARSGPCHWGQSKRDREAFSPAAKTNEQEARRALNQVQRASIDSFLKGMELITNVIEYPCCVKHRKPENVSDLQVDLLVTKSRFELIPHGKMRALEEGRSHGETAACLCGPSNFVHSAGRWLPKSQTNILHDGKGHDDFRP